jgi:hypothetical protein
MRPVQRVLVIAAMAFAAMSVAAPASALMFVPLQAEGFRRPVLLIRDCGLFLEDYVIRNEKVYSLCAKEQEGFSVAGNYPDAEGRVRPYAGDPEVLASQLGATTFDEVWLLSGGGMVNAGIRMAQILREHGMAVRVPNYTRLLRAGKFTPVDDDPAACVSSCTVTFMGGVLRAIDDDATYQVHSASVVLDLDPKELEEWRADVKRVGLAALAGEFASRARQSAVRLVSLFQDTLVLPLPRNDNEKRQRDYALTNWSVQRPRVTYPQAELDRDTRLLDLEGDAALQDIVMKLERRAMTAALGDLRPLAPGLGRRADLAIDMLAAMYDVSIKESFTMTREAMLKMGYITQEITIGK